MTQNLGALSGSREPDPQAVPALAGFDPARMVKIMANLEAALVLTAEHSPFATVASFVASSTEFGDLAAYLHSIQHLETPNE